MQTDGREIFLFLSEADEGEWEAASGGVWVDGRSCKHISECVNTYILDDDISDTFIHALAKKNKQEKNNEALYNPLLSSVLSISRFNVSLVVFHCS